MESLHLLIGLRVVRGCSVEYQHQSFPNIPSLSVFLMQYNCYNFCANILVLNILKQIEMSCFADVSPNPCSFWLPRHIDCCAWTWGMALTCKFQQSGLGIVQCALILAPLGWAFPFVPIQPVPSLNTLRPWPDGCHFADDIFMCIFFNKNCCILIKFSVKYVRQSPIDINRALV